MERRKSDPLIHDRVDMETQKRFALINTVIRVNPSRPRVIIKLTLDLSLLIFVDEVACVDPDVCYSVCQSRAGCTNIAFPKLVLGILPEGDKAPHSITVV